MLPNYQNGSLVNLMSSILQSFGVKSNYQPLEILPPEEIKPFQNVILVVLDGLGWDSLQERGEKSFLNNYHPQTITSVFPATTTAAVTTFFTGVSPKEHGLLAWYMYLKEFEDVAAVLPFCNKEKKPLKKKKIAVPQSIFAQIKASTHLVLKKKLRESCYNQWFLGKAKFWGYNNLRSFGSKIYKAATDSKKKKYIYAYWPGIDDFSHHYGKEHPQTKKHLEEIEIILQRLVGKLKGTNTLLIITADHGQISTTIKKTLILNKHPLLKECLSIPHLCGETRAVFLYVKPEKKQQFERYIKHKFGKYGNLYKPDDLIKQNYFGLGKEHPSFRERIGDYIFIPQENYIFREYFISKEHPFHIGNHGGFSEEEMLIPLIKIRI